LSVYEGKSLNLPETAALTRMKGLGAISIILILSIALAAAVYVEAVDQPHFPEFYRVACVGDSITQITSYPNDLQTLLGSKSTVGNFGVSGSTVILTSPKPYMYEDALQGAIQFKPTTVIIMLGTNDARSDVYFSIDRFVNDYKQIISQFQSLKSKPRIFLVIPPPVFNNTININGADLVSGVDPRIEQVANETGLPLINVYAQLLNHPDYFLDGVHPNNEGAQVIANTIYQQITSSQET